MEGNHFNEHGIKAIGVVLGYFKNYTKSEYICIDDMGKCSEFALAVPLMLWLQKVNRGKQ